MAAKTAAVDAKVDAAVAMLDAAVESIVTGEEFVKYLRMMATFHAYSWRNSLLILAQRPDATMINSYKRWQGLGRQVQRGESGIRIFAPIIRKTTDEESGAEESRVVGFRIVSVFDVKQTAGDPLPMAPAAEVIDGVSAIGAAVEAAGANWAAANGITVESETLTDGSGGYYNPGSGRIVIGDHVKGDDRARVMVHELAHWYADHRVGEIDRRDAETVAEAAAYVVMAHYGIETVGYSAAYVAGWAADMDVFRRNLAEVRRVAAAVIAGVSGEMTLES